MLSPAPQTPPPQTASPRSPPPRTPSARAALPLAPGEPSAEDALADLAGPVPAPREAALGAFRRHLGRLRAHVQQEFEEGRLGGLAAARLLAQLTDTLITA
ncbi:MAG: hypothetical protein ACP5NI_11300, partial [Acetobacteraceae bacterium]